MDQFFFSISQRANQKKKNRQILPSAHTRLINESSLLCYCIPTMVTPAQSVYIDQLCSQLDSALFKGTFSNKPGH